jgi:ferredoxin
MATDLGLQSIAIPEKFGGARFIHGYGSPPGPDALPGSRAVQHYAPRIFKLDDNRYVAISQAEVAPEAAACDTVAACPERTLSIEDGD